MHIPYGIQNLQNINQNELVIQLLDALCLSSSLFIPCVGTVCILSIHMYFSRWKQKSLLVYQEYRLHALGEKDLSKMLTLSSP